jgi:diadenosine tetraphosphate (Ap4A) HIT family hydrolase
LEFDIIVIMYYSDFLKSLTGCPFCDGVNKVILQSGKSFLTYALAPYHKHHLLVIPNRHVESLSDLDSLERGDIAYLQNKALEILRNLGYTSISLLVREGNVENKSINHTHFHIIPNIRIGDLDHKGEERKVLSDDEIKLILEDVGTVNL